MGTGWEEFPAKKSRFGWRDEVAPPSYDDGAQGYSIPPKRKASKSAGRCKVVRNSPGDFSAYVNGKSVAFELDDSGTEAYGGAKWGVIVRYPRRLGGNRLYLFDTKGQAEKAMQTERTFGRNAPACKVRVEKAR